MEANSLYCTHFPILLPLRAPQKHGPNKRGMVAHRDETKLHPDLPPKACENVVDWNSMHVTVILTVEIFQETPPTNLRSIFSRTIEQKSGKYWDLRSILILGQTLRPIDWAGKKKSAGSQHLSFWPLKEVNMTIACDKFCQIHIDKSSCFSSHWLFRHGFGGKKSKQ